MIRRNGLLLITDVTISVIITNHKYECYLDTAILSVLTQEVKIKELIIIDDHPQDTVVLDIINQYRQLKLSMELHYHAVDFLDPMKAREFGFSVSTGNYICFLDADDTFHQDYLRGAIKVIVNHPDTDIVYSDMCRLSATHPTMHSMPDNVPRKRISQYNIFHIGCLTRRKLIEATKPFATICDSMHKYHEDWLYWRNILSAKCTYRKQSSYYNVRSHPTNRSRKINGYYEERAIDISTITYVAMNAKDNPFYLKDWDLVKNNHPNRLYAFLFGDAPTTLPTRCHSICSMTDKLTILNHVAQTAFTDYLFFYNEANPPLAGTVQYLLQLLDRDVGAVHNALYEPYECTLAVTSVFKDYLYDDIHAFPFDKHTERVICTNPYAPSL